MQDNKAGQQTIGCEVESCSYFKQGGMCDLNRIVVKPHQGCNTGEQGEETLCGSYHKGNSM